MPSKDDLKEIKCSTCNKIFYVEPEESPEYCPYCLAFTSSDPEFKTTHKCSLTSATFTHKEAHELNACGALGGRIVRCSACKNVIEK